MAYTGGSARKGHLFKVYKRVGKSAVLVSKGPLIIIFRIDALYGCISLFIKYYQETMRVIVSWHYMKMRASS